jgi:hypothetical protein
MNTIVMIYHSVPIFAGFCFKITRIEAVSGLFIGIFMSTGFTLTVVHPKKMPVVENRLRMKLLPEVLMLNVLRFLSLIGAIISFGIVVWAASCMI